LLVISTDSALTLATAGKQKFPAYPGKWSRHNISRKK